MKKLRNLFALLIVVAALYACDSTVTVDDPKSETIEEVTSKTGSEGNDEVERPDV